MMSNVLQLINDKLLRAVVVRSEQPSAAVLPCDVRPIPFEVPTSFRSRGQQSNESHFGHQKSQGQQATAVLEGATETTPDHVTTQRTSLTRSLEFRGALGSLDPRLYRKPDDDAAADDDDDDDDPEACAGLESEDPQCVPRIWFSVDYEPKAEKLLVTVIKTRHLKVSTGDHFVRVYLLPDERRYMQTKCKKKILNPHFDESFVFQVSSQSLEERVLKLTVYEIERLKRHVIVGHALFPLKELLDGEKVSLSRVLLQDVTEMARENGELLVSLSYKAQLERLCVGILQGRGFKRADDLSLPDAYVKASLLLQSKVVKTKKTDVIRRSVDPCFNESLTFKLSPSELDLASVSLTAMHSSTPGVRDRAIGRVVIGSFMFARTKEQEHWNKMIATVPEQVVQWHSLT